MDDELELARARARAKEQEARRGQSPDAKPSNPVGDAVRTAVGSLPGGDRLMAVGRMIDDNIPYREALNRQQTDVGRFREDNPRTALALAAGANAPLFWRLPAYFATRAGGAVLGSATAGLNRALAPKEESMEDRATGILIDAGIGAGVGFGAPWALSSPIGRTAIGAAFGGWLAPKGTAPTIAGAATGAAAMMSPSTTARIVADATGRLAPRISKGLMSIAEATGLRGDVNREFEGMDRIAKFFGGKVGEQPTTGQTINETASAFWKKSGELYNTMRNAVTKDERMKKYLENPDFKEVFDATLREMGLPPETSPLRPDVLHMVKRIVRNTVDRKYAVDAPLSHATAARIEPKIGEFTKDLHAAYPEAQLADRFFEKGMVADEGYRLGYGATKPAMQKPSVTAVGEQDVPGTQKFIDRQSDDELKNVASEAARAGATAGMRDQVASAPLDAGRAGLLDIPILRPSGAAASQRGLAAGPKARQLESLLGTVESETAGSVPTQFFAPWEVHAAKEMLDPNINPLTKPGARKIISTVMGNPEKYQSTLEQYRRGLGILEFWNKQMSGQSAASLAR